MPLDGMNRADSGMVYSIDSGQNIKVIKQKRLTLLDIIIVSRALLEALMATLSVVACSNTNSVCRITYTIVSKKCAKTPKCSLLRRPFGLGSVAVQNRASIVS